MKNQIDTRVYSIDNYTEDKARALVQILQGHPIISLQILGENQFKVTDVEPGFDQIRADAKTQGIIISYRS